MGELKIFKGDLIYHLNSYGVGVVCYQMELVTASLACFIFVAEAL